MKLRTLDEIDVSGKKVLFRADFNVPFAKKDHPATADDITDDFRIRATVPTIRAIIERGGIPVIIAHLGRPKGPDPLLSLRPVSERLSRLLEREVIFSADCIGESARGAIAKAKPGDVVFLENVRFYDAETRNDPEFAKTLASLGDVYVNEAFGDAHRAHASMVGVPKLLPHAAGPLMIKEVDALSRIRDNPTRPLVAVMGGAKISTKMKFLEKFLPWVDMLLLGGALASTLVKAKGIEVGTSFIEDAAVDRLLRFDFNSSKVHVPVDVVLADRPAADARIATRSVYDVGDRESIYDIGPETQALFGKIIRDAGTVFWNGPMGMHEVPVFSKGTESIAHSVALSRGFSVVGGGDTTGMLERLGLDKKIGFISTGGGAMLEFLCGEELPALAALARVS